jgi:hypothetical protein
MRAENQNRPSCSCWCGNRQLFLSALSLCLVLCSSIYCIHDHLSNTQSETLV